MCLDPKLASKLYSNNYECVEISVKNSKKFERRYFEEENDPFRIKYLTYEDAKGITHTEDLTIQPPKGRASASDVTLFLYTRDNPDNGEVMPILNLDGLIQSEHFDRSKPNYVIIHGWNNNYQSEVNNRVKQAVLNVKEANIFVVDWSGPANKFYTTAFSAVPEVGAALGDYINKVIDHFALTPGDFKLIGHSLGAHIAGCAGAAVNGLVDSIIALDPAGPLFSLENKDNRVDEGDAQLVQIIHTSGGLLSFTSSIGHADYFPNDGSGQPGCGLDLLGTCAHSRAYIYLEESIRTGGFTAVQCGSYKEFTKGECSNNAVSYLGGVDVDKSAAGDYYLDTQTKALFSLY